MFLELFLFETQMILLTRGGIHCIARFSFGTYIFCAGTHWSGSWSMVTVLLISSYIECIHICIAAFIVHFVYR